MEIKFAIIGRGFGKNYTRLLKEMGINFITANKDNANKTIKWADAVIIASPAKTHFEYIKKAKNKHILVEKPMVMSVKEALEVKKLLGNKVFMVGHQYCYNDEVRKLKPLKKISLTHSYQTKNLNPFWEISPHLFSVIDLLGFRGEIELKIINPLITQSLLLTNNLVVHANSVEKIRIWLFDGVELKQPKKEPLKAELEHFIDCIKTGKTPLTDIEHGIRVIKQIEQWEK